jgi:hypothetical protein
MKKGHTISRNDLPDHVKGEIGRVGFNVLVSLKDCEDVGIAFTAVQDVLTTMLEAMGKEHHNVKMDLVEGIYEALKLNVINQNL